MHTTTTKFRTIGSVHLIAVILATACGGGGGGENSEIDELYTELTKILCDKAVECSGYPDAQTCLEIEESSKNMQVEQVKLSIEAGKTQFDSSKAQSCLESFRSIAFCSQTALGSSSVTCEVFAGQVQVGGTCLDQAECAGDSLCLADAPCQDSCCMGTCTAVDPSPQMVGIGEDCTNAPCVADAYCQAASTRTCVARVAAGGACDDFDACVDGALCDLDIQTGTGTCIALAAEGQPCDATASFDSCDRLDNYCDSTQTVCKRLPGAGQPCATINGFEVCPPYATCENGTCTELASLGEACTPNASTGISGCIDALECVNSVCTPPPEEPLCQYSSVLRPALPVW